MATVLVVDDDPTNREFLRTLLVYRGHQVREAADGDSALDLAGDETPDAVITDVLMPGLDGYELARRLRDRPATSTVPIAFSTAHYERQEILPLARACGVQDVILKPSPPTTVLAAIDALLDTRTPARRIPPAGAEFAVEHRLALKTKLMEKAATVSLLEHELRASRDREADLRRHAAQLAERLAETQRLTRSGTWDLDPRTGQVVLSAGLCDLLRLPASSINTDRLWQRVHPDDLNRALAKAKDTIRTGRPHVIEVRVADETGVVHDLTVSCRAATSARREIWGVAQDVTEAHAERLEAQVRADWRAERRALHRFRAAVLPAVLPVVAGLDLAAEYLPAPDRLDGGGDWFDALVLADGGVVVSVGAVAGHDRPAPAVMGPVRAVLRAYARDEPDPARVLARLNGHLLDEYHDDTFVTAVVARYDPADPRRAAQARAQSSWCCRRRAGDGSRQRRKFARELPRSPRRTTRQSRRPSQ